MYVTSTNLVHYLIARGHVTHELVVSGQFSVTEVVGRNRNFRVTCGDSRSLFVKQIKELDQTTEESLRREAICYQVISDCRFESLKEITPGFVDYDPVRHLLIVEQIVGAENLTQCHRRLGSYPVVLAERLGDALGVLHRSSRGLPPGELNESLFTGLPPWSFSFHERDACTLSPSLQQLLEIVRADDTFCQELDSLRDGWLAEELIHGDLKWSNCLVFPDADGRPRIHLVDWEMADLGDPVWDVAGALQGYLSEWILRASLDSESAPEEFLSDCGDVLSAMRPAMQELWRSYNACLADQDDTPERVLRCMRYVGARMLMTVIEYQNWAGELNHNRMTMIGFSQRFLCDPHEAASLVLGNETAGQDEPTA